MQASRDRAATSLNCQSRPLTLLASGSSFCVRSPPAFADWRSCSMATMWRLRESNGAQAAARTFGFDITKHAIRRAEDIAPAFEAFKSQADALYVVEDALVFANRAPIVTLALEARLPTSFTASRFYVGPSPVISQWSSQPNSSSSSSSKPQRRWG